MSHDVVIVAAARTPQGRILGQLAPLAAAELGTIAIRGALQRSGVDAAQVESVIMGHVLQAGAGQNPARQAAIGAGIGWGVPTVTINKVCFSGLAAIIDAARIIRAGEATVVVAGGQESMTNAPHELPGSRKDWNYASFSAVDSVAHDGLTDAFDKESMGASTEKHNGKLSISRTEQDEVAAESHLRAAKATADGLFESEITPVEIAGRKGEKTTITTAEGVRPDSCVETLAKLRPAFSPDGAI